MQAAFTGGRFTVVCKGGNNCCHTHFLIDVFTFGRRTTIWNLVFAAGLGVRFRFFFTALVP